VGVNGEAVAAEVAYDLLCESYGLLLLVFEGVRSG
jgi:hypothetical protein